ncbi:hypothetical protein MTP10_01650 [Nonomuraea sp. 3-1Str]|uniref:hypothetical protein n=1 Tax=Nonomuraea sp. 3-1Str TaxID=2929801 RepID=UPI00285F64D4|nr:hypothetical protein [Nonomuraea sp. 3-1Str]MDR8407442.1 hypothetical protein [Nonomuraea sp. 3-1Str]
MEVFKAPPGFRNTNHEQRLQQFFTDTITEFRDQPDRAAHQVMLYAQSAMWAVQRGEARWDEL